MVDRTKNKAGKELTDLGLVMRTAMARQSVSVRKLSEMTGISAASISRMMHGGQTVGLRHLLLFSRCLEIPVEPLLSAMGISAENTGHVSDMDGNGLSSDSEFLLRTIQGILHSFDMDLRGVVDDIRRELKKYERYALTEEGERMIRDTCEQKINEVNGAGMVIEKLTLMHRLYGSGGLRADEKAAVGSALLYFILSADCIPDYLFPIGYLDDAMAVEMVSKRFPELFD